MQRKWKTVLCFLVGIGLTVLMGFQGQLDANQQKGADDEPDISQFPTIDYSKRKVRTEKQKQRSKKYNSQSPAIT